MIFALMEPSREMLPVQLKSCNRTFRYYVEGNIYANGADITGNVFGNIAVKELLQLRGQSNVKGNIAAGKLQIDPSCCV